MQTLGEIRLFSQTGSLENLALKLERRVVESFDEGRVIHELLVWDLETLLREVTRVVDEVNGSGSGHDVDGGGEDG